MELRTQGSVEKNTFVVEVTSQGLRPQAWDPGQVLAAATFLLTPQGSHFLLCTTKIKSFLVYITLGCKNKAKRVMVLLILPLLQPKVARGDMPRQE